MAMKVVLLIEDDADDERLTRRAFQKANITNEVIVACDGEEALALLYGNGRPPERSTDPDLIILDLRLPKVSGLDVLRRIRAEAKTKYTPVVVLTSSASREQAEACYVLGANSFVIKPVDAAEFADMVVNLGLYWLLLNIPCGSEALSGSR